MAQTSYQSTYPLTFLQGHQHGRGARYMAPIDLEDILSFQSVPCQCFGPPIGFQAILLRIPALGAGPFVAVDSSRECLFTYAQIARCVSGYSASARGRRQEAPPHTKGWYQDSWSSDPDRLSQARGRNRSRSRLGWRGGFAAGP